MTGAGESRETLRRERGARTNPPEIPPESTGSASCGSRRQGGRLQHPDAATEAAPPRSRGGRPDGD